MSCLEGDTELAARALGIYMTRCILPLKRPTLTPFHPSLHSIFCDQFSPNCMICGRVVWLGGENGGGKMFTAGVEEIEISEKCG